MTKAEFNVCKFEWANKILSQPAYYMPNGKVSHDVALEVKSKAMDNMLDDNRIKFNGTSWWFAE